MYDECVCACSVLFLSFVSCLRTQVLQPGPATCYASNCRYLCSCLELSSSCVFSLSDFNRRIQTSFFSLVFFRPSLVLSLGPRISKACSTTVNRIVVRY